MMNFYGDVQEILRLMYNEPLKSLLVEEKRSFCNVDHY